MRAASGGAGGLGGRSRGRWGPLLTRWLPCAPTGAAPLGLSSSRALLASDTRSHRWRNAAVEAALRMGSGDWWACGRVLGSVWGQGRFSCGFVKTRRIENYMHQNRSGSVSRSLLDSSKITYKWKNMDMSLDSLGPARPLASQGVPLGLLRGGRRRPGARARPSGGALSHGDRGTALGRIPGPGRSTSRQVFLNVQAAACRTSPGDYKQESTRSRAG